MNLSILVVNWNTRDLLRSCLASIQDTAEDLDYEVLVVDNASTDGSEEMVRQAFPGVHLIENTENVGFARANNQAIRASSGRYVLLLNSDAFLTSKAAQEMVSLLDRCPEVGIVGSNLFYPGGERQVCYGPLPSLQSEVASLFSLDKLALKLRSRTPSRGQVETGTVSGACMMARRQMLDQTGLFDESYFMFSEEVDLCLRAHQAGWKVYHLPDTRVIHLGGGSTGLTPSRMVQLYQAKLQYFAKYQGEAMKGRLWKAMRFATLSKLAVYRLVRWISFGRIRKDELWQAVSQKLAGLV